MQWIVVGTLSIVNYERGILDTSYIPFHTHPYYYARRSGRGVPEGPTLANNAVSGEITNSRRRASSIISAGLYSSSSRSLERRWFIRDTILLPQ